ncbi:hypothetical protein DFQ28_002240 [Apophysomyces sp. BC1034]|nr:hypothetical protein DFQ28_002240 [Apophysomyces sp. BC1034]
MQRFGRLSAFGRQCGKFQPMRLMSTRPDYVPGVSGYAPEFAPPENARDTPKMARTRRNLGNSLPSHLPNAKGKTSSAAEAISPKKQYREELRSTRHVYARELLEKHGRREAASATKRAAEEERMQTLRKTLEEEREQKKQHESEVVKMLELELPQSEATVDREAQRIANRRAHEELKREDRFKQLVKLYNSTADFVTLENLDAKVDEVIHQRRPPFVTSTISDMLDTPAAEAEEVEKRKALLKEAMGL